MHDYYVYIMANRSRTLYRGFTNNLPKRVYEHKHMLCDGFTRRYLIDRLVYYEASNDVDAAIRREKQVKGWLRRRKVALIESMNPEWKDPWRGLVVRAAAEILRSTHQSPSSTPVFSPQKCRRKCGGGSE